MFNAETLASGLTSVCKVGGIILAIIFIVAFLALVGFKISKHNAIKNFKQNSLGYLLKHYAKNAVKNKGDREGCLTKALVLFRDHLDFSFNDCSDVSLRAYKYENPHTKKEIIEQKVWSDVLLFLKEQLNNKALSAQEEKCVCEFILNNYIAVYDTYRTANYDEFDVVFGNWRVLDKKYFKAVKEDVYLCQDIKKPDSVISIYPPNTQEEFRGCNIGYYLLVSDDEEIIRRYENCRTAYSVNECETEIDLWIKNVLWAREAKSGGNKEIKK